MLKFAALSLALRRNLTLGEVRLLSPCCSVGPIPPYIVFTSFLYQPDSLENVRDVVDTALLNFECVHSLIEVQSLLGSLLQQSYESVRKSDKTVFLAIPFA
jgi:hypothetical protein